MRTATIFESFEPVKRYLAMAEDVIGYAFQPAVRFGPIDAFLLKQFASCYPLKFIAVDMAGEATLGMSTVFCAALDDFHKVVVIDERRLISGSAHWKDLALSAIGDQGQEGNRCVFLPAGTNALQSELDLRKQIGPVSALFIMLAAYKESSEDLAGRLSLLLTKHGNAIVALTAIGPVGSCSNLEAALAICHRESAFKFVLLREISPFCAGSQVGLLYRKDNRHVPEILDRIKGLFQGNFDFLQILEANINLQIRAGLADEKADKLDAELAARQEDLERLRRALASRTEELAAAYAVPPDAAKAARKTADGDRSNSVGQVFADLGAVTGWLRRGTP